MVQTPTDCWDGPLLHSLLRDILHGQFTDRDNVPVAAVQSPPMESPLQKADRLLSETENDPHPERPKPRFGLCAGEFVVPDDFDDPLPDDLLADFLGE
jgi:hypothetical protein